MATWPLVIDRTIDLDGDMLIGYYSKGHHDPAAFLAAVDHDYAVSDDYPNVAASDVVQEYWRSVPIRDEDRACSFLFAIAPGPGRGAYPVTVLRTIYLRYPEEAADAT